MYKIHFGKFIIEAAENDTRVHILPTHIAGRHVQNAPPSCTVSKSHPFSRKTSCKVITDVQTYVTGGFQEVFNTLRNRLDVSYLYNIHIALSTSME